MDPASARVDRVYLTEDREYARYYASLYGYGDLYQVEPVGELERSPEDLFRSHTAPSATVRAVYARAVVLTMGERRRLFRRWSALEGIGARDADHDFQKLIAEMSR